MKFFFFSAATIALTSAATDDTSSSASASFASSIPVAVVGVVERREQLKPVADDETESNFTETDTDSVIVVSNDSYKNCPVDHHGCYCCEKEWDTSIYGKNNTLTCRTDHYGRFCCGEKCSAEDIHPKNETLVPSSSSSFSFRSYFSNPIFLVATLPLVMISFLY